MTILLPLLIALALGLLLLYVRMEQRRRRREMGLRELTPDLRDLRYHDLKRLRDFDEALQLDVPLAESGWTDVRFYGGAIKPQRPDDKVSVVLAPGEVITDPDRAEQLGLTVDARRMREAQKTDHGGRS